MRKFRKTMVISLKILKAISKLLKGYLRALRRFYLNRSIGGEWWGNIYF